MGWYQRRVHGESPVESASGRMTSLALTLSSLFALTLAAPTPQELTVTVGDSAEGVQEPGLVVVVDSSDGGPLDFGGLGGFGDFGRRPSGDGGRVPGIINTLFDALGSHLGVQIDSEGGEGTVTLHGGEGGPVGDGEYDHHNSTFDEKVLSDGSVVRVNRTTIKDTDENGNSFFFSSSVHHVLQEGDGEEEEGSEEGEIPAVTDVEEDFNADQYDEEAELVPTDIDETKNKAVPADVDESENEIEREAKSEFDGTDATASVEDIF